MKIAIIFEEKGGKPTVSITGVSPERFKEVSAMSPVDQQKLSTVELFAINYYKAVCNTGMFRHG